MRCPVCKNECGEDRACSVCGFNQFRIAFLSREDADDWLQNVVIPYRAKYHSQAVISSVDWTGMLYQSKEMEYFLDITVPAALKQNVPIGHTLIVCPHGQLVYTFVSELITTVAPRAVLCSSVNEQQLAIPMSLDDIMHSTLIESYERSSEMFTRIANLPENSIFVQAGTMLPTRKEPRDALSSVLSEFNFEILIGKGPDAKGIRLDTAPFTLLAVANKESDIPKHFLQYFENIVHFDLSGLTLCEVAAISTAIDMCYTISPTAAKDIADYAENNTHKAAVLTRRICDYLLVKEPGSRHITDISVKTVLSQIQ